jgi:gamma-glutamyl:cysteine ligase YbdK (ATP-grasp superfamily)
MDPHKETQLWSHEYNAVYESYNRIFNCKGHGWSNLQCTHMNLPFSGDDEFGRLHAAIRLILPALPALAASSPIADRQITQFADTRLNAYLSNSARIPSITAGVIPEAVFTHADYDREIFQRMYVDIAPFDTENILKHEWLNSRGAIARFDRGAIEIRLLDIQECPAADLAILSLITAVLKSLVSQQWLSFEEQKNFSVDELKSILLDAIRSGDQTPIGSDRYVAAFGIGFGVAATLGEFWQSLAGRVDGLCEQESLDVILNKGTLSRRIVGATGLAPTAEALKRVYGRLCDALAAGRMFDGAD